MQKDWGLDIHVQNVRFQDLIKMAKVILTMKIMPDSPDVDLSGLKDNLEKKIKRFAGETQIKFEESPIGFGLVALNATFMVSEDGESTDKLEEELKNTEGVNSVEVTDMRRALG
jgi:elongation factor 1-beta